MKFKKGDFIEMKKSAPFKNKIRGKVLGYSHNDKDIVVIEIISKSGKSRKGYYAEKFFKRRQR